MMILRLLAFTILSFAVLHLAHADQVTLDLDSYDISRVYDGDTFYIDLKGFPDVFGDDLPIRLKGVDTAELRSRCPTDEQKDHEKEKAEAARDDLMDLLALAEEILISNMERGTYFRVVADVSVDGIDVGDWLVANGHAYYTPSGSRIPNYWCDS